ncbi:hypothetical protein CEP51_006284 [Fusarium floridanum]|uniref:Uncharacterized protein n=1 Tax=Fusarium floridanum TaxID=1325733 RepID=A0A428RTI7_9HYPO|nr:hypothetical protein CEP51_006284 [Fusarium floridanum]
MAVGRTCVPVRRKIYNNNNKYRTIPPPPSTQNRTCRTTRLFCITNMLLSAVLKVSNKYITYCPLLSVKRIAAF